MPSVSLSKLGANGKAHNWTHVLTPLTELETLFNNTKLDYLNLQDDGTRVGKIRSHAAAEMGRIKVRNDTGSTLDANDLVYITGTYNDGTDNYPTVALAVSTQSNGTTKYACGIVESDIANNADGTIVVLREVSSLDTSGLTVGAPVWLSDTAGGYETTLDGLDDIDYRTQIVGYVTVVNASTGRILFGNWHEVPYSIANEVAD
tara:strand:- start:775 stop:1386 length:612 start_codon:yes stop_codon:yes gene_type:complete